VNFLAKLARRAAIKDDKNHFEGQLALILLRWCFKLVMLSAAVATAAATIMLVILSR